MSPQRTYILQKEAKLLTITLEALFASVFIDSHEGISLQKFDVPVEYLHTSIPNDKVVNMKFKGELVDIMCEVDPG